MSNTVIAFFLSAGIGAWLFNYFMNRTGNQASTSLTVAGIVAALVFIITLFILGLIPNN